MTREEAIKTVRLCCPKISDSRCDFETAMRILIPELRESENERIRKEIVEYITKNKSIAPIGSPNHFDEMLTWLEKQKEHQNNSDAPNESSWTGIISSSDKDKNLDEIAQDYVDGVKEYNPEPTWDLMQTAVCYGYHYREQKEQKPADRFEKAREKYQVEWSEEDKMNIELLVGILRGKIKVSEILESRKETIIEQLKSLRPQSQRRWSEEDEKMNKEIRLYLKQDRVEFPGRAERINKMIEWLINIYPQPQPNMSISFMLYLDEIRPEGKMCLSNGECADIEDAFNNQDWPRLFKYISKYQPHWKPSEEQITNLLRAEGRLRLEGETVLASKLAELYEHLKNLM